MQTEEKVEIKSALWQKIFALAIFILMGGVGICTMLAPFFPELVRSADNYASAGLGERLMLVFLGLFEFAIGFYVWWQAWNYCLHADADGITQRTGFHNIFVRWQDVASYTLEVNRGSKERHVEPVLRDAGGEVIFRIAAHVMVSSSNILDDRKKFWQFVEKKLEGKKVEAPSRDHDPAVLAARSLEVDWSKKSLLWKIGRIIALVCYVLFWLCVTMALMYYVVSRNITIQKQWSGLLILPMFIGPLLPHIIWLHFKKRQIARQLQEQQIKK